MAGIPGEQCEGIVTLEAQERAAEISGVGRVALAFALAAVCIDPKLHGAPSPPVRSVGARSAQDLGEGRQQNPQIERKRPLVDVLEIHPHPLVEVDRAPTTYLP